MATTASIRRLVLTMADVGPETVTYYLDLTTVGHDHDRTVATLVVHGDGNVDYLPLNRPDEERTQP